MEGPAAEHWSILSFKETPAERDREGHNYERKKVSHSLTVNPGDDAILLCEVVTHTPPSLLVWTRSDLGLSEFVYFDRGDVTTETYQHSSYRGRVQLLVPHMKDGNASVVLKNVTMKDAGIYECRIETRTSGRKRRQVLDLISTVDLKVENSGNTDEDGGEKDEGAEDETSQVLVGLIPAVVLTVILVLALIVVYKYKE